MTRTASPLSSPSDSARPGPAFVADFYNAGRLNLVRGGLEGAGGLRQGEAAG
jgi:hypothetical protein